MSWLINLNVEHSEVIKHYKDLFNGLRLNQIFLGSVVRLLQVSAFADGVDQLLSSLLPLELAKPLRDLIWRIECPNRVGILDLVIVKNKFYQFYLLKETVEDSAQTLEAHVVEAKFRLLLLLLLLELDI